MNLLVIMMAALLTIAWADKRSWTIWRIVLTLPFVIVAAHITMMYVRFAYPHYTLWVL